jgi:alkanesulfonate monooxygenase SsuD/methylene tetrahydromethanopterin reductase-like flavin-dependent oxidoreductase (luciferase family)
MSAATTKTGVCLPLRSTGADHAVRLGVLAEELGFDSVWVSELASYDAIAVASAIAVQTSRIRIGTCIVPLSTRTPALHAMGLSTLGRLAPGRSIVGYGASTEPIIEGWHGQVLEHTLARTRDLFAVLDQALAGERTAANGSNGFRLEAPAERPALRFVGALGPKMRAYTRAHADGLLLNLAPHSALKQIVAEERTRAGFELALPIRVAVRDVDESERRFRRELASYMRVPVYRGAMSDHGYADVIDAIDPAAPLAGLADGLPDGFVHDVGVLADARERFARVEADGVTPLAVPVVEPGDFDAYEETLRALAAAS